MKSQEELFNMTVMELREYMKYANGTVDIDFGE